MKFIFLRLAGNSVIHNQECLLLCSRSAVSDSLQPHGLWHARLPCPSPSPGACQIMPAVNILKYSSSLDVKKKKNERKLNSPSFHFCEIKCNLSV